MPIEDVAPPPKVVDIDTARAKGIDENTILQTLQSHYGDAVQGGIQKAQKAGIPTNTINDAIAAHYNNPVGNWDVLKKGLSDARDKIIDLVKPIADAGATMAGTAATPELGVAGGLIAGAGTDALLQRLQSNAAIQRNQTTLSKSVGATPGSIEDTTANAVQNETVNELLGKVFGYVGGKVKSLMTPVDPELAKLGPTMSQYAEKPGTLSSLLENVWGHSAKQTAMQNSAEAARSEFGNILSDVQPVKPLNPADRFNIGKLNDQYNVARRVVENVGIKNAVPVDQPIDSALPPKYQSQAKWFQKSSVGLPTETQNISGPIQLTNTVQAAQKYLANAASQDDPILTKQANDILNVTKNGQNPIPFKDAMDRLVGSDGDDGVLINSQKLPGEINKTKDIQGTFADALHKDIQGSIDNWNDPDGKAFIAYNTARSSAIQKQVLSEGGNVQSLVSKVNSPIPQIDTALQNPIQTQKLLNTSNLAGLPSSNMRQDLAGYRLQQIWNKADTGTGTLNGQALLKEWNNPSFEATKGLLFGSSTDGTAARINQFFTNVAKVSNAGDVGGAYGRVRLGYQGIAIPAGYVIGNITGQHILSFAGVEIPPMFLGRLLSKPIVAQTLQRAITSQPLEMSTQQAGRLIMGALNGATVNLVSGNGQKVQAKVVNGQIQ